MLRKGRPFKEKKKATRNLNLTLSAHWWTILLSLSEVSRMFRVLSIRWSLFLSYEIFPMNHFIHSWFFPSQVSVVMFYRKTICFFVYICRHFYSASKYVYNFLLVNKLIHLPSPFLLWVSYLNVLESECSGHSMYIFSTEYPDIVNYLVPQLGGLTCSKWKLASLQ